MTVGLGNQHHFFSFILLLSNSVALSSLFLFNYLETCVARANLFTPSLLFFPVFFVLGQWNNGFSWHCGSLGAFSDVVGSRKKT